MTAESFLNGKVRLLRGDCLELLPTLEADSIDSVCTDPPYHLTSIVKRFGSEARTNMSQPANKDLTKVNAGAFRRLSKGFMGKQWDGGDIAFRPELWAEVWRVLKPGAHLVAFGGDRTQHRLACAIEDAGFEIRGTIAWIFGQGFPKNHNVSQRLKDSLPADVLCVCDDGCHEITLDSQFDYQSYHDFCGEPPRLDAENAQDAFPSPSDVRARNHGDQREDAQKRGLASNGADEGSGPLSNASFSRLSALQLEDSPACDNIQFGTSLNKSRDELKAARRSQNHKSGTEHSGDGLAVSSWRHVNLPQCRKCGGFQIPQGLGSALKPAMELICLARKPLSESSIAQNVLKHGTGAINVDGCRVECTDGGWTWGTRQKFEAGDNPFVRENNALLDSNIKSKQGRWPANLIHDGSEEVVRGFPETLAATSRTRRDFKGWQSVGELKPDPVYEDGGGSAARFFYTAKADSDDRLGSRHPTVKPIDLMQYLVRLVTPKGGTCLDLFAGTGTTGEAAWREGMVALLIEREPEYQADIVKRMGLCLAGPDQRAAMATKQEGPETLPLFHIKA